MYWLSIMAGIQNLNQHLLHLIINTGGLNVGARLAHTSRNMRRIGGNVHERVEEVAGSIMANLVTLAPAAANPAEYQRTVTQLGWVGETAAGKTVHKDFYSLFGTVLTGKRELPKLMQRVPQCAHLLRHALLYAHVALAPHQPLQFHELHHERRPNRIFADALVGVSRLLLLAAGVAVVAPGVLHGASSDFFAGRAL
jgi:hypothetical protein